MKKESKPPRRRALAFRTLLTGILSFSMILPVNMDAQAASIAPKLVRTSSSVVIGGSARIRVKNASKYKSIKYKAQNKNVSVSKKGLVKGLKAGRTKIFVTVRKGSAAKRLTYTVKVKAPYMNRSSVAITKGGKKQLTVKNKPKSARYTWSSSKPQVASVSAKGLVKGRKTGSALIRVKVRTKKKTYTLKCHVKVIAGQSGTLSVSSFSEKGAEIIKKNGDTKSANIESSGKFASKRLIIQGKYGDIDFSQFSPKAAAVSSGDMYIVQFASQSAASKAYSQIKDWPEVKWAEPDKYMEIPEDGDEGKGQTQSSGSSQTSSGSDGTDISAESLSWGVSKIGADRFARSLASNRKQITVAVVDTGVAGHSFLMGRIQKGGWDFVDNDSNPDDKHYHGTHVAGTVVDCPPGLGVKILPVRVLNAQGRGSNFNVASGIKYAADHNAQVINLSLGGAKNKVVDDSIDYAVKKGVTVCVAAGNDNKDTQYYSPAHKTNAVVVAATNLDDSKAWFSNYGSSVDIAAPGMRIYSCVPGGSYRYLSGTSMATPHVAAVAAMFKLKYPSRTPAQIESLIKGSARDLGSKGWDKCFGYGIPDLAKQTPADIKPTGVSLNKSGISLERGKTYQLTAAVSPSNAVNKSLTWSSSNSKIAAVSGAGLVKAVSKGQAEVTVKTWNNKTAACKVTVTEPETQPQPEKKELTLNVTRKTIYADRFQYLMLRSPDEISGSDFIVGAPFTVSPGETIDMMKYAHADFRYGDCPALQLKASLNGKEIDPSDAIWTCDNNNFTVEDGKLTGSSSNGVSESSGQCTVTVTAAFKTDSSVTAQSKITCVYDPKLSLEVLNSDIASIDSAGKVTGKKEGAVKLKMSSPLTAGDNLNPVYAVIKVGNPAGRKGDLVYRDSTGGDFKKLDCYGGTDYMDAPADCEYYIRMQMTSAEFEKSMIDTQQREKLDDGRWGIFNNGLANEKADESKGYIYQNGYGYYPVTSCFKNVSDNKMLTGEQIKLYYQITDSSGEVIHLLQYNTDNCFHVRLY